jgi:hypothetical protein
MTRCRRRICWVWLALAAAGATAALPVPARAQFFGYRYDYGYQRPSRPPPPRGGFFSFPFFNPGPGGNEPYSNPQYRPQAPAESNRAPPPKKLDTPPASTVVVVGDSMADWLAYGLEEALGDTPDLGVERKIRTFSGLIHYDSKNDTLEWPAAIKEALAAEKPAAIVVMLGLSDRVSIRERAAPRPGAQPQGGDKAADKASSSAAQDADQPPAAASEPDHAGPGGSFEFHTDKWAELYGKRIDDMIAALKSKGVPILWVGMPALRGTRSTSDMSYLDELYREHAEKAGIVYVDIWDGFVDDEGHYTVQGPDFEGQTRRLRTADGVHFTKAGAVKLASYVEQQLRRVMTNHLAPVALPAPEAAKPSAAAPGTAAAPAGQRPTVGPVVPLTASLNGSGTDSNDLLGAANHSPPPAAHDPVAADVLSRGDPIPAAPGRADDFSWPRPTNDADTAATESQPTAPPPPAKAPAANTAKKPNDAKAKAKPLPTAAPRAQLDGGN